MGCGSSSADGPQKPSSSKGHELVLPTSPRSSLGSDEDITDQDEPLIANPAGAGARALAAGKGRAENVAAAVKQRPVETEIEMALPPGMSSLFIVEPLVLNYRNDGWFIYYGEIIRCAAMTFGGYAIQVMFISEIWAWDLVCRPDEEQIGHVVQICCALTFEIAVFSEIRSAFDILLLLLAAPTKEWSLDIGKYFTAEQHRGAIVAEDEINWFHGQLRRVRGKPMADTLQWSMKNMNRRYKRWAIIGVALPKLILSIVLSIVAGIWVPKSPDTETLLLNTLAVNFIVEVDNILYKAFVSDGTKQDLASMTPIKRSIKGEHREVRWALVAFGVPFCVFGGSWLLVYIENYLSRHCQTEYER